MTEAALVMAVQGAHEEPPAAPKNPTSQVATTWLLLSVHVTEAALVMAVQGAHEEPPAASKNPTSQVATTWSLLSVHVTVAALVIVVQVDVAPSAAIYDPAGGSQHKALSVLTHPLPLAQMRASDPALL